MPETPLRLRTARPHPAPARRAFTLVELLVVILIIAILIAILIPSLAKAMEYARKARDSTHIRAVVQGMTVWATNHDGQMPLPSAVDLAHTTIDISDSEPAIIKDNTGNILSLLIFHGHFVPEQAISPQETNEQIRLDEGYQTGSAEAAAVPEQALWDPGFAGMPGELDSFTGVGNGRRDPAIGNNSYATAMPFGDRRPQWSTSYDGNVVLAGNRGPMYIGGLGAWMLSPNNQGTGSNTLRFYGREDRWEGNLAFADGRVEYFAAPDPTEISLVIDDGNNAVSYGDNVFMNEHDNGGGSNGLRTEDQGRPGRWRNAFIRPWGNVRATDVADPQVTPFRD